MIYINAAFFVEFKRRKSKWLFTCRDKRIYMRNVLHKYKKRRLVLIASAFQCFFLKEKL